MKTWQDCYNRYVEHLNAVTPLTKRIPDDIRKLMTKAEIETASAHLNAVQEGLSEDAKISAKMVVADFTVWRDATDAYVSQHNEIVKNAPTPEREKELEARKNNYNGARHEVSRARTDSKTPRRRKPGGAFFCHMAKK